MHGSRKFNACYRVVECVGLGCGIRLRHYTGLRTTPGNNTTLLDLAPTLQTPPSSGEVILSYSIL